MLLALHQPDPRGPLPPGFDRYYVGDRFCVRRFMRELKAYSEQAAAAPGPVWLATPAMIEEHDFDRVTQSVLDICSRFEGVLIGDIGLGRKLKGRTRLAYWNTLSNSEHALRIRDTLGVELVRAFPPVLETLSLVAEVVNAEGAVHGSLPLGATPRCLTRLYLGCEHCDETRLVHQGPLSVTMRGNVLYTNQPIQAFGLIENLHKANLYSAVIEGLGIDAVQLRELADIYRGRSAPPNDLYNAIFDSGSRSGLDTPIWRELRKGTRRSAL